MRRRLAALAGGTATTFAAITAMTTLGPAPRPRPVLHAAADAVPPGPGTSQVVTVPAPDGRPRVRRVWVYRPGVPDSATLPVLYFLHGLPGSYTDIADLDGKQLLDRLIMTRRVRPFVLVVPDGNSSAVADPEWADSPAGTRLESFVTTSLARAVEGLHPRDRAHRAIAGFSMGGYGAMNIALHHPDLYGAVAAIAGYFDTDDESGIFQSDRELRQQNSPDHHVTAARSLHVVLADGTGDADRVTRGETQRFAKLLRDTGARPDVDITSGTHSLTYLRSELPRVLALLVGPSAPA